VDLKEHILVETDQLFCRYGIKSVTMDDIAKHLGISKKTIYLHFEDKNDLVYTLITRKTEMQTCVMDEGSAKAENAIHEAFLAVTQMQETLSNMNPMLLYDMQKYHPDAWALFRSFKEKQLFEVIRSNIERGIKEGYFREDIDPELFARMRVQQIDSIMGPGIFAESRFSMLTVMVKATEHFVYGLSTQKGHEQIDHYKSKLKEE
jgi:AcrR family transcriptional regulator